MRVVSDIPRVNNVSRKTNTSVIQTILRTRRYISKDRLNCRHQFRLTQDRSLTAYRICDMLIERDSEYDSITALNE